MIALRVYYCFQTFKTEKVTIIMYASRFIAMYHSICIYIAFEYKLDTIY